VVLWARSKREESRMDDAVIRMETRLARVERRSRLVAALCVSGVAGAFLLGFARPAATKTQGVAMDAPFKIVSPEGKVIAQIEETDNGGGEISFYGKPGSLVAQAGSSKQGGFLDVFDGKISASLETNDNGRGGKLVIYRRGGSTGARLDGGSAEDG